MWLKILAVTAFAFYFSIDPGWDEVIKMVILFPLGARATEVYLGWGGISPDVSQGRSSLCSSASLTAQICFQLWWFNVECPSLGSRIVFSSWPRVEGWSTRRMPEKGGWRPGPPSLTSSAWLGCVVSLESSGCEKKDSCAVMEKRICTNNFLNCKLFSKACICIPVTAGAPLSQWNCLQTMVLQDISKWLTNNKLRAS